MTTCFDRRLTALAIAFLAPAAHAGEIGHYSGGVLNIRDYFVPEPGLYGAVYNYFYTTDRINDGDGHRIDSVTISPANGPGVTLDLDVNVDMYVLAPSLIYSMDTGWNGIKYGALISPTFANASLEGALSTARARGGEVKNTSFNVGDVLVQPLWFGKTTAHWDFALGYGFYAPVGKYDTSVVSLPGGGSVEAESADNIGFGFWTHQFQGSVAWYPWADKRMAVASTMTYEIHGEKDDFDLTPGDTFTFNWGISQFLPLKSDHSVLLEVGLAGYFSRQVSDDSGSDAGDPELHDRVDAVGGQIALVFPARFIAVTFHGFSEFDAEDRFEGESYGLSVAKKF